MNEKVGEKPLDLLEIRSIRRNNKYEHYITIPAWWLHAQESAHGAPIKCMVLRFKDDRILMVPSVDPKRKRNPLPQGETGPRT